MECVTGFQDDVLAELLDGAFRMTCLRICPSDFGLPITRDRKYMLFLSAKLQWHPAVEAMGQLQLAFSQLFLRQVQMRGDMMLRAPNPQVDEYIRSLAHSRHLPDERAPGKPWSCFLAMSKSNQASVLEHERALIDAGFSLRSGIMSNIAQRASHMGPVLSGNMPALLRNSWLWSFRLRRLALPLEMLELQGYNIFGDEACRSCISDYVHNLSAARTRSLAGNAMHIQAIGSAILFLLSCTVTV